MGLVDVGNVEGKMALNVNQKSVWGWAMYDWANSAFATTVMAGFFPLFFKQYWSIGTDVNTSTALLGLGNSAASLLVALCAPVLGVLADRCAARKTLLICLAYPGALATALLWAVPKGEWGWAIICRRICFLRCAAGCRCSGAGSGSGIQSWLCDGISGWRPAFCTQHSHGPATQVVWTGEFGAGDTVCISFGCAVVGGFYDIFDGVGT
jgi:UMF1 family MFS transporter